MKYVLMIVAALALMGGPAKANCYEHCHTNSSGDTTCHINCY